MPHAFDANGYWTRIETRDDVQAIECQRDRRNWRRMVGQLCFLAAIVGAVGYFTWSAVIDLGNGIIR